MTDIRTRGDATPAPSPRMLAHVLMAILGLVFGAAIAFIAAIATGLIPFAC